MGLELLLRSRHHFPDPDPRHIFQFSNQSWKERKNEIRTERYPIEWSNFEVKPKIWKFEWWKSENSDEDPVLRICNTVLFEFSWWSWQTWQRTWTPRRRAGLAWPARSWAQPWPRGGRPPKRSHGACAFFKCIRNRSWSYIYMWIFMFYLWFLFFSDK